MEGEGWSQRRMTPRLGIGQRFPTEVIVPLRGHLVISKDILGCQIVCVCVCVGEEMPVPPFPRQVWLSRLADPSSCGTSSALADPFPAPESDLHYTAVWSFGFCHRTLLPNPPPSFTNLPVSARLPHLTEQIPNPPPTFFAPTEIAGLPFPGCRIIWSTVTSFSEREEL